MDTHGFNYVFCEHSLVFVYCCNNSFLIPFYFCVGRNSEQSLSINILQQAVTL